MKSRKSHINRKTKETEVLVEVNLDGTGMISIKTGLPFLDHLVTSLSKHAMLDLKLSAKSMDGIDHHLIEDTAIALGNAMDKSLGDRTGIVRFGYASVPMDESLADASLDLIKRQYQRIDLSIKRNQIEGISKEDLEHFFRSLAQNLNICMHVSVKYGDNDHHKIEAAIKAFAVAWRTAASYDNKQKGIPSTKGAM
ncbi:MAG: imidazoleglycerol-phosphate dehydratase HisB [Thaumarchaeota archaeon]|nr:imidazoleglycerol-phosphate dehydratase HisB [Nitrososphaerota archaeon]MDE1831649.1 imidazoleglycerol-phosphate dehydratase HisB [Nitrososphaerota archaeon]MDE1841777.1 imidazoleglycerol-phosphate dehydratase HisB [Nitrososphaerota archaeon]MDE1878286.1 imidazoleglycerol-phosphate dehydratase HisB [Nitrososphaerota archaeon]